MTTSGKNYILPKNFIFLEIWQTCFWCSNYEVPQFLLSAEYSVSLLSQRKEVSCRWLERHDFYSISLVHYCHKYFDTKATSPHPAKKAQVRKEPFTIFSNQLATKWHVDKHQWWTVHQKNLIFNKQKSIFSPFLEGTT